jgi:glyoxylase-like metal-dependent hydrolase (beta-lactamase superfamily II)
MKVHSILAGIANVHIVEDERGVIIVDAGWSGYGRRILSAVARLGYQPHDVRLIWITHVHADHAGSAAELKRLTGAPVGIHEGDAGYAAAGRHHIPSGRGWIGVSSKWLSDRVGLELSFEPFIPDVLFEEGQTLGDFGLKGYMVHTPGHTRGSMTLVLEEGITFVGDALINLFKVGFPMYWEDPAQGRESGRRIQGLKPRVIYSGHGRAFGGGDLDRYLEMRMARNSHPEGV